MVLLLDSYERVDSVLVPVPKKGDHLSACDNWRGIALLEVVGKVAGHVVQTPIGSNAWLKRNFLNLNVSFIRTEVAVI